MWMDILCSVHGANYIYILGMEDFSINPYAAGG